MSAFDNSMSAAEVSDLVFGRRDWPLFVSLWACLMNDVFLKTSSPSANALLLKKIRSPQCGGVSGELRARRGHAAHPALVIQELDRRASPPSRSAGRQRSWKRGDARSQAPVRFPCSCHARLPCSCHVLSLCHPSRSAGVAAITDGRRHEGPQPQRGARHEAQD